jgi:hypothetical protein
MVEPNHNDGHWMADGGLDVQCEGAGECRRSVSLRGEQAMSDDWAVREQEIEQEHRRRMNSTTCEERVYNAAYVDDTIKCAAPAYKRCVDCRRMLCDMHAYRAADDGDPKMPARCQDCYEREREAKAEHLSTAMATADALLALVDDGLRDAPSAWTQRTVHEQIRHARAVLKDALGDAEASDAIAVEREAARIAREKAIHQYQEVKRLRDVLRRIRARIPTAEEAETLTALAFSSRLALIGLDVDEAFAMKGEIDG